MLVHRNNTQKHTHIPIREMLAELEESLRTAAVLPVRLSVADVFDGICTELVCTAYIDVGGRGRPRVTYDVTAALADLGLRVFQADIFWVTDAQLANDSGGALAGGRLWTLWRLCKNNNTSILPQGVLHQGGFQAQDSCLRCIGFLCTVTSMVDPPSNKSNSCIIECVHI